MPNDYFTSNMLAIIQGRPQFIGTPQGVFITRQNITIEKYNQIIIVITKLNFSRIR